MIGIYMIKNKVNKKVYIGQSYNIKHRIARHKRDAQNIHLKNAIEKYGLSNFDFIILRNVGTESGITKTLLDCLESFYINKYNSTDRAYGYNLKGGGANGRMSEEVIERVSKKLKGRKISNETREKISMSLSGRNCYMYGIQKTKEIRDKISISKRGKNSQLFGKFGKDHHSSKKIVCVETGKVYYGSAEVERILGINQGNVSMCCVGRRKTAGGFSWEFVREA